MVMTAGIQTKPCRPDSEGAASFTTTRAFAVRTMSTLHVMMDGAFQLATREPVIGVCDGASLAGNDSSEASWTLSSSPHGRSARRLSDMRHARQMP
jgi:hypothetical protein